MHKFKHALLLNKRFDRDSKMVPLFAPSEGSLGGARFSQNKVRVGVPPHAGRWLQLMASDKSQWRAPRLDNDSGSTSQTCSSSRMSSDDRSRDRSASPRPQPYRQCQLSSPPSMLMSRRRAIAKLKDECSIITYIGTIWTLLLGLEWSTVLFDAPQIPAGMHQFRRIPQESTGIQWNGTGIQWNGTGIQRNEPGFHWIVTEGTCISACKYKCVFKQTF